MSHPRRGFTFHLATDACVGDDNHKGGFGAVLTPIWEYGVEHVIAYASRSLKPNEENNSVYLLELVAASWAIDIFSVYLHGKHFELFTDHKPLETLSKVIKRLWNTISKLIIGSAPSNSAADSLSGNVALKPDRFLYTMSDESGDIISEQKNYRFVSDVRDFFLKSKSPRGFPGYYAKVAKVASNCFLDKGVVCYNIFKHGGIGYPVILCHDSMKHMVMDASYCSPFAGHSGKQRTVDGIELGYWWPGLTYYVQNFLHKCPVCQELQGQKPIPSPLNPLAEPNMRVYMDLFGPLTVRSANGKKYITVMTDIFSKFTELAAICDKKAETVAKVFFEHWICRHGVPAVIFSDRGKEFLNDTMKKLCEFMGMDHNPTSSYHSQSNAQAETYNKTMIRYLSCMLDNNTTLDWEEMLPAMMMAYNCHVHQATKESPFFLTYQHNPRLPYFNMDKPQLLYGQTC